MDNQNLNFDIHKIMTLLPHRYPILLVDRVLEMVAGKSIKALKNVTINEPHFVGHFPTRPVMPGVLIIEALAQAACLMTFANDGKEHDPASTLYYFAGIENARFREPVEPGHQLILDVEFERKSRNFFKFKGVATVEGKVAAEANFTCVVKHLTSSPTADAAPVAATAPGDDVVQPSGT